MTPKEQAKLISSQLATHPAADWPALIEQAIVAETVACAMLAYNFYVATVGEARAAELKDSLITRSEEPKKYALFEFSAYYPCGGMYDLAKFYTSIEEAQQDVKDSGVEHAQIVDTVTWETVWDQ